MRISGREQDLRAAKQAHAACTPPACHSHTPGTRPAPPPQAQTVHRALTVATCTPAPSHTHANISDTHTRSVHTPCTHTCACTHTPNAQAIRKFPARPTEPAPLSGLVSGTWPTCNGLSPAAAAAPLKRGWFMGHFSGAHRPLTSPGVRRGLGHSEQASSWGGAEGARG
ncbi:hypothetical protein KIL84_009340 [Mauremys mutica]|uniref:Uncharacterized protein n=1 Tax=Mauremys mutica TaxID=74926 RepID=A0A9D3XFD4_9SAUR|nr:hypothetical protein KIL84_009340 [Mauremys mutica]